MTRTFLHLMSQSLLVPAMTIGTALLLTVAAAGQTSSSPPAPPRPEADASEGSADKTEATGRDAAGQDRSKESASETDASDRSSRSSASGRSTTGREDRSSRSSTSRDSARSGRDTSRTDEDDADRSDSREDRTRSRDSDRSERDRSARDDDDDDTDNRSTSRRSDAARDDDDDSDGSDRRDERSVSRDADDDRSRERDGDSDDRFSSRDRSSTRDDDDDSDSDDRYSSRDRSSARDRLRDDVRETARDVRDTVRDARDTARETARDARSSARSVRDSVSRSSRESRQEFDVSTVRAADVGIWFNRSTSNGLVISDVANTGPIARLGFREGDRIISVDGYRVSSERQFVQDLFYDDIRNERVPVVVFRNGAQRTIYVEPATLVEHYTSGSQSDPLEKFGLVLDDRYTDRLVVWKVIPRTPAYYAGIRTADVITTWDNTRVARQDQLLRLVEQAEDSGDNEVRLTIYRGQQARQLEVEFPQVATRVERRTSYRPALEEGTGTFTESYPAVEGTTRPGVIDRPRVVPRPGILPRNR